MRRDAGAASDPAAGRGGSVDAAQMMLGQASNARSQCVTDWCTPSRAHCSRRAFARPTPTQRPRELAGFICAAKGKQWPRTVREGLSSQRQHSQASGGAQRACPSRTPMCRGRSDVRESALQPVQCSDTQSRAIPGERMPISRAAVETSGLPRCRRAARAAGNSGCDRSAEIEVKKLYMHKAAQRRKPRNRPVQRAKKARDYCQSDTGVAICAAIDRKSVV